MYLVAPRNLRETLQLLSLLDPDRGLHALLDQIDWSAVFPQQIYDAILDRLPESAELAASTEGYSALRHARAALISAEFQINIVKRTLEAFPEKTRLLFVHVPKCAGTDLTENLRTRYPWLSKGLGEANWTSPAQLLAHLRQFVIDAQFADTVFVSGHFRLKWYLTNGLYRNADRLFAAVRHPHELVLSQVNYILKRFREDPEYARPDTRAWIKTIGESPPRPAASEADFRELGFRILANSKIVRRNFLCHFLGNDTADSAIAMLSGCDIELTEIRRYTTWLNTTWGIASATRLNEAHPILKWRDLDRSQRDYVSEICDQDLRLYERIVTAMDHRGDCRISGRDLA
jgi:hypothetical protein